MQQIAIQASMSAATAMAGQSAHAAPPKRKTEDGGEQESGESILDVTNDVMQQRRHPLTPVRSAGQPPPGMKLFRVDDTGEEIASAISMDPYYVDTPARRQRTKTTLVNQHEDSPKKDMHNKYDKAATTTE